MKLVNLSPDFSLDFKPLKPWPAALPLICSMDNKVVAGFERKKDGGVYDVLVIPHNASELLPTLHDVEQMPGFEFLRFTNALYANLEEPVKHLLNWPLEFQLYCDHKKLALKNLKPLTYVSQWMKQICDAILLLSPSSSQTRELIELLCDLNFKNISWEEIAPKSEPSFTIDQWILDLTKKRYPLTTAANEEAKKEVNQVAWPKGVTAKWEKRGDQSALLIQSRIFSNNEWQKIRDQLSEINLSESTWKI